MNYQPATASTLIRSDWQRLSQIMEVRGQKLRTRHHSAFPATTRKLVSEVLVAAGVQATTEKLAVVTARRRT